MRPSLLDNVPKAANLLAADFRRRIVTGELPEGSCLPPEAALTVELGVARSTVRETLRILESEGLITVRRGARNGARVTAPRPGTAAAFIGLVLQHRKTTLADVFAVRVLLEAPAARLAAQRRNRRAIADDLDEYLARQIEDPEDASAAVDFHRALVAATDNPALVVFTDIIEQICETAGRRARTTGQLVDADARRAQRGHRALIQLIRSGRAEDAEEHWGRHLSETGAFLVERGGDEVDLVDVPLF